MPCSAVGLGWGYDPEVDRVDVVVVDEQLHRVDAIPRQRETEVETPEETCGPTDRQILAPLGSDDGLDRREPLAVDVLKDDLEPMRPAALVACECEAEQEPDVLAGRHARRGDRVHSCRNRVCDSAL